MIVANDTFSLHWPLKFKKDWNHPWFQTFILNTSTVFVKFDQSMCKDWYTFKNLWKKCFELEISAWSVLSTVLKSFQYLRLGALSNVVLTQKKCHWPCVCTLISIWYLDVILMKFLWNFNCTLMIFHDFNDIMILDEFVSKSKVLVNMLVSKQNLCYNDTKQIVYRVIKHRWLVVTAITQLSLCRLLTRVNSEQLRERKKLSEILMSVDPSISATKLKKISLFLSDFA